MTSLFHLGIRQKMVAVLLTVLTIALGVAGWLTFRQQETDILQATKQHGTDVSRFMSQSLALSVVGYDYHSIQLILDEVVNSKEIAFARVKSAKGNTMAESGVMPSEPLDEMSVNKKIVIDGMTIGELFFYMNNEKIVRQLEARKNELIKREIFIIILVAIGEFLALSYIIARPVTKITNSLSRNIGSDGIISQDLPVLSDDEFGTLAKHFNTMRANMNQAHARLQSRVSIVDKELRQRNEQLLEQSIELKRVNEELKHLSVTDSLTGIYNRRHFDTVVQTELYMTGRYGEPTSLMIIDIDFFKKVNDTYGHNMGDRVLRELASFISEDLREADTLCRIGGEEFGLLCRRTDKKSSILVAEKMRKKVEAYKFRIREDSLGITVSIGISTVTRNGGVPTLEDACRQTDSALYYSKNNGRNCVYHLDDLPIPKVSKL